MLGVVVERSRRRVIVILKNFPCRWGQCIFCPFSLEAGRDLSDVLTTNQRILELLERAVHEYEVERITVFNGGSFPELPLDTVLRLSKFTAGRDTEIETRPEYLSEETIHQLLQLLRPRTLTIRIGIEVWDEYLRNRVLRKGIPQSEVLRIAELRRRVRSKLGEKVRFVTYVLFGIEYVPEEKVVESVEELRKLFDGVVAVQYRRVLETHPRSVPVSTELLQYLREKCLDVDVGESEEWTFTGEVRYLVT